MSTEPEEKIWGYALVFKTKEGLIETYAGALISDSYEKAIGAALSYQKEEMTNEEKALINFDACELDNMDLEEFMKRKGWKKE